MINSVTVVTLLVVVVIVQSASQEECLKTHHSKLGLGWGLSLQSLAQERARKLIEGNVRRRRQIVSISEGEGVLGSNKRVYVEQVKVYNLNMYDRMCSYYLDRKRDMMSRYGLMGVNKVGCAVEENRHEVAVVCVYKIQT
ncbi:hypothetical protein ACHWQZ_G019456 [Mnemiopsis leidyi]